MDFTAAATDADGDPLTYLWDFDNDGSIDATGASAAHTYTDGGSPTREADRRRRQGRRGHPHDLDPRCSPRTTRSASCRALVFSKTAAFRHGSIPAGITAIKALGTTKNFQVDATEDAAWFRDDILSHYDTVIFLSTTGDVLTDTQQAAFERYIRAGGGYVGIHSAADTEYGWPWYGQLVGAYFRNHPNGTPHGDGRRRGHDRPVHGRDSRPAGRARTSGTTTNRRSTRWSTAAATTTTRATPPGIHVLLTMDESTYAEADGSDGVDDDHPIAWCHRYDGGRAWYTGSRTPTPRSPTRRCSTTCRRASRSRPASRRPRRAATSPQANQHPTVDGRAHADAAT